MKLTTASILTGLLLLTGCATGKAPAWVNIPLFKTEAEAQAHCPGVPTVWVNAETGVYHLRGEGLYGGNSWYGAYACKDEADRSPHLRHGNLIDD